MSDIARTVEAVWRIEGRRIVTAVAKMTGDLGLAEDVAQEAVAEALETWPRSGEPRNAAAWLTATAKRRAIDAWRRRERLDERYRGMAQSLADASDLDWEPVPDDVLRLIFIACHPLLSRESQVALTLRVVAGMSTTEIARMLLVPVPTAQARITRAKRSLAEAHVPFASPDHTEWPERLAGVLSVVYLIFTEGYASTAGERVIRPDLADEALRLGRVVAGLVPHEPEAHALVALMELQRSRFRARERDGVAVLLADQDRTMWDHAQIARGVAALERADAEAAAARRGRGAYALQAAIAQCHARASSVAETEWARIVVLYDLLARLSPNPVVELNRAVAVSMATGPANALMIVDRLAADGALRGSHLLPSVRGELLARLGRREEAEAELRRAAQLTANAAQRDVLRAKADALS